MSPPIPTAAALNTGGGRPEMQREGPHNLRALLPGPRGNKAQDPGQRAEGRGSCPHAGSMRTCARSHRALSPPRPCPRPLRRTEDGSPGRGRVQTADTASQRLESLGWKDGPHRTPRGPRLARVFSDTMKCEQKTKGRHTSKGRQLLGSRHDCF